MKKTVILLLCLTMMVALSMTTLVACQDNQAEATAIEVVNPVTEYLVNDTINYDNLQVKITYKDGTSKEGTLAKLNLSVNKEADLTQAGETSYTIGYGALTYTVNITVSEAPEFITAFSMPNFYVNYLTASADRPEGKAETRGDFRITGETYEVGNVNKFIFRPTAVALDENDNAVNIANAKTTAKVYEKATFDGEYVLLPDTDLEGIVTIENNTYKFSKESAGKYYKVEVTLDGEEYNLSGMNEDDCTVEFECVVVDGGYNVYDQMGFSVMSDLNSSRWAEVWKCEIDADFNLTATADSVKLEADDKPLCEYVGNVDWVILHTSFEIDADLLPSYYFWTEETEGYQTAYSALQGYPELQKQLVGTLRDGLGNGQWFRVMNMKGDTAQTGINGVNMQKALYSTLRASVSGNYNSITAPITASEGGRNLYSVLDHSSDGNRANPTPHWAVFQMHQSQNDDAPTTKFTFKNIATTGNCGQQDTTEFVPAGLLMYNYFGSQMDYKNVVGNSYYTNVTCDAYGDNQKVLNVDSVKLYNAYSNMFYSWRAAINITNSELIGSGGPLFILCDGSTSTIRTDDSVGPNLTVDSKSVLQAYATGEESWYSLYNAQTLITAIKTMDPIFNNMGKTIQFTGESGLRYLNVLAAIICEPGDLLSGLKNAKMNICGAYKSLNADGSVNDNIYMNNLYVQSLKAAVGGNGTLFPVVFQTGDLFMFTDTQNLYTLGAQGQQAFNPATDGLAWATDTHKTLGVYMSAGSISKSANAPYFGVVLGFDTLSK